MTFSEPTRTLQRAKTLFMTWRSIALNVHSHTPFTQQRHHTAHCTVAGIAPGAAPQHERCEQAQILRRWAGLGGGSGPRHQLAISSESHGNRFLSSAIFGVLHVNTEQPSSPAGGGRALRCHASLRVVRGLVRHRRPRRGHHRPCRRVQRAQRARQRLKVLSCCPCSAAQLAAWGSAHLHMRSLRSRCSSETLALARRADSQSPPCTTSTGTPSSTWQAGRSWAMH
jgi:hypothetical protein